MKSTVVRYSRWEIVWLIPTVHAHFARYCRCLFCSVRTLRYEIFVYIFSDFRFQFSWKSCLYLICKWLSTSFITLPSNTVDKHGVVERCDFEQGLCFWEESDVDTPGAEWMHHKGQEAWPNHGPPRDHTLNSAAGLRRWAAELCWIIMLQIYPLFCNNALLWLHLYSVMLLYRSLCYTCSSADCEGPDIRVSLQNITTQLQLHCEFSVYWSNALFTGIKKKTIGQYFPANTWWYIIKEERQ